MMLRLRKYATGVDRTPCAPYVNVVKHTKNSHLQQIKEQQRVNKCIVQ